jgi:hypothetical protein
MSNSPKSSNHHDDHSTSDNPSLIKRTRSGINKTDPEIITICKDSRTFQYTNHHAHHPLPSPPCSSSSPRCSSSSSSSPPRCSTSCAPLRSSSPPRSSSPSSSSSSSSPPCSSSLLSSLHHRNDTEGKPHRKISCCRKAGLTVRRWWFNTWDACKRQFY